MQGWGKYMSVAFEMIATVVFFVFLGRWVDHQWPKSFPFGTFFGALLGVGASLYVILKKF
jgi:F0F1-type ATP synthase assembly protein I